MEFEAASSDRGAIEADLWDDSRMAWAKREFSKGRIDRAGAALAAGTSSDDDLRVISNWRSAHSYPLQSQKMTLLRRAKGVDQGTLVAQRLKRLESMQIKLQENAHMKLSQMQDIGGCRAILPTVADVDRLATLYEAARAKNPNQRAEFSEKYDYITEPKSDGYRSLHFVYKYRSASKANEVYNGQRIEIQIRSKQQHAWSTARELVALSEDSRKYQIEDESWARFFALMGSEIALREKRPIVPGTPRDPQELKRELRALAKTLDAETVLMGIGQGVKGVLTQPGRAYLYLLVLDTKARTLHVLPYQRSEVDRANDEYLREEKIAEAKPERRAVLISVESVTELKRAYPNYYLDTGQFVLAVKRAIA